MEKITLALMAVVVVVSCMFLTGCGNNSQLEKSAVPIVTQIAKEAGLSAECVSVEIKEKVKDNFYKAVATLTTGEEVKITIVDKGNQILVTIVPGQ